MKRILLTTAAALLGLGALGFASSHAVAPVQADCDTDLSNKLLEYVTGGYTKLTTMFLTPAAQGETQYFHGGANALQRATYYNAGETALLMGNYDGTFAGIGEATGINSGYRNNGENTVTHFTYTDDAPTEANLFSEEHRTDGWSASNQSVGDYYRTLTKLSNSVKGTNWWWDGTFKAWGHTISDLSITDGEYSDPLLKDFQYFAAPMMLQNKYFSWTSIRVAEASNYLSIRLYASSSDAGKSTLVGETEALISEAKVFKGIHFAPTTDWVIKGIGGWDEEHDIPLVESPHIYLPEQFTVTTSIGAGNQFKLFSKNIPGDAAWYGCGKVGLESTEWFASAGEGDDPNIKSNLDGKMTLWWKPTQPSLYIGANKANITFTINNANPGSGKAVFIAGTFTEPAWKATSPFILTDQGNGTWSGTFEFDPVDYDKYSEGYQWKPVYADISDPVNTTTWPYGGANINCSFEATKATNLSQSANI